VAFDVRQKMHARIICLLFITVMFLSCRESQSVREFDGSSKKIEEFVDSKANQLPRTELKDPPWTGHFCDKCESKDFGCYPKSTSKGLRTQAGLTCNHAWKQITEEEYQNLPLPSGIYFLVENGKIINKVEQVGAPNPLPAE
jgi:hypothetical protein